MSDLDTLYNTISSCIIEISHTIRKFNPISLGSTIGSENSSGEQVKELDLFCNNLLIEKLSKLSSVRNIASEEEDELIPINKEGKYLVSFDPLDGSSNIDSNILVGTIFCVFEYVDDEQLKDGSNIVMSGYSLYGGSTQLIVCKEKNTSMYNLNPENNTWNRINDNYKMKDKGNIYSINESHKYNYNININTFTDLLIDKNYSARWVGSLVADFHRTLLKSGVVMYPGNDKNIEGKIRLVYEAYPLAYIMENSNGTSFDGKDRMLSIPFPQNNIHKRIPIFYGSKYEMNELMNTINWMLFY